MEPLVTIAIPTFRRLHYLRESVGSALAQSYRNIEILISHDPGSDREDAIRQWASRQSLEHSRLRYHVNAARLGLAGNWNACADAAKGDLIVIIGDDDRLMPSFVETLVRAWSPDVSVVFSNHYVITETGEVSPVLTEQFDRLYSRRDMPAGSLVSPDVWVWRQAVPILSCLIRTADVRKLRFREDLNTPEVELFARLASDGAKFVYVPEYLAEYRVHMTSETSRGLKIERLINYLRPLTVSAEARPFKTRLMSRLVFGSIGRALRAGDPAAARTLLKDEFCPSLAECCKEQGFASAARLLAYATCARLPRPVLQGLAKAIP